MKKNIIKNLSNIPGWRTKRKIIVIESDDWGSIRMPSLSVYNTLLKKGVNLDGGDSKRYNTRDNMASKSDLEGLFDVLLSVKDREGNPSKFTAVSLVANPDFQKIKESQFQNYYFEPFTATLNRYGFEDSFSIWKKGLDENIFIPEFHGREHLNVMVWMRALQANDKSTMMAFNQGVWGFRNQNKNGVSYQAAFDLEYYSDLQVQTEIIESGLNIFEQLHGYKAAFFVPPNGPFKNDLEEIAANNGIKFMSASKIQKEVLGEGKFRKVFHYLGQKNKYNQKYITRNCFFEPSSEGKDWVDSCLRDIDIAFRWKKPAIISSHRVNYIGSLNEENRSKGLRQLRELLNKIIEKWPEVEFMTSSELGELMQSKK
jgi:hypothetical protein